MENKLNILVVGVGGNVSIGILKALRKSSIKNIHIFGACIQKNSAGFAFSDEALICPNAASEEFMGWLRYVEDRYEIDLVISGVDEVNEALSNRKSNSRKAIYLTPEAHNIEIFKDKLKTVNWLQANGIDYPITIDLDSISAIESVETALALPLIVKPRLGKGSNGIAIIRDINDLAPYAHKGGYIAQQLIGNSQSEYTCGVYKSRFGYTEVIVMRRNLKIGSTSVAEVVFDTEIEDYCRKIASCCNTQSPFNVQLRVCEVTNRPYCFEINMRLSGTTAIRHEFGFKDCEAWISEEHFKRSAKHLFDLVGGIAIRYEEEVYFKPGSLHRIDMNLAMDVKRELTR